MKIFKNIIKWTLYFLTIPFTYILVSLILGVITINEQSENIISDKTIYLSTNGVHLDIVIPSENVETALLSQLQNNLKSNYISFGWGDENFYINTPTWNDLTFSNAFKAIFLKSSTLMHITQHQNKRTDWVEIKVTEAQLQKLNTYILGTFQKNNQGKIIILENQGYSTKDDFYKAKGSYSCFKTCNSWVNTGLKQSGLKSCLWTPFDFGVLNKYEN